MMKKRIGICILLVVLFVSGCSLNIKKQESNPVETTAKLQDETEKTGFPITVTDQAGREVVIEKPAERVVSSYYISTAIVIALGKEDSLVGIEMKADTRELYKRAAPELLELPAVGSGKGINVEETANLTPDVVILPAKLKDAAGQFELLGIPVLVVDPETQENFNECVLLLGEVLGTGEQAETLLAYYTEKTEEVKRLTQDVTERPSVYLSSGSSYLRTCTSEMYQNEVIKLAGGRNVSEELTGDYWAEISKEQLLSWNPEYILPVSYAEYAIEDITGDSSLSQIDAIREDKIFVFPSALEPWDYPTPSSILGILWLTHTLHPELYEKESYIEDAGEFYKQFFEIEVVEADLGV